MAAEQNTYARPLVWINAGELSGDLHAAALRRAFKEIAPEVSFTGMGGPALATTDFQQEFSIGELSVMGLTEVMTSLPRILNLLSRIKKRLAEVRPEALILVDAPEFNFRVAKIAHNLGIPAFYYISPKLWAWRQGRVNFLRRYVRRVLSILPFEEAFYASHNMEASYIGNPIMDQLPLDELDRIRPDPHQIGLLPGSRTKEINSLLPEFVAAARIMYQHNPELTFALARAPNVDPGLLSRRLPPDLPISMVEPEDRYAFMRQSRILLAASGTVTLEAALIGTPCVVAYKLSPITFLAGLIMVKVKYISLPNLILDKAAFPELLQKDASGPGLAAQAERWLNDPQAWREIMDDLKKVRQIVGPPGASRRAASIILHDLGWAGTLPGSAA